MNMDHAAVLLRMAGLIFSFYGYLRLLAKRIRPEFGIAVIFSAAGSLLFLAGILNLMPETAFALYVSGIALGIRSVRAKEPFRETVTAGTIFFGLMGVFLFVLLYHDKFLHYDNFSHWALVVKVMLAENRFPNFLDTNIMFQSYPPGSAAFIYYIVKAAGIGPEWLQMYAQAIFMAGMAACLFAFAGKQPVRILMAAVLAVMLLAGNMPLYDLLVDTQLPLAALAGLAFCACCRGAQAGGGLKGKTWYIAAFTTFLVTIKNSGVLFVCIILLYLILCHGGRAREAVRELAAPLFCPLAALVLWKKHVSLVFEKGLLAKHSMSIRNFRAVFGEKSADDLKMIARSVWDRVVTLSNPALYILLFLVLLLALQSRKKKTDREDIRLAVTAFAAYFLYQLGILGMYLFSMPLGEAAVLASYDRYNRTILIFIAGIAWILTMEAVNRWEGAGKRGRRAAVLALCIAGSQHMLKPNWSYYKKQEMGQTRLTYDALIRDYHIPSGGSYMVITSGDTGYLHYMSKYLLLPKRLSVRDVSRAGELERVEEEWGNFDYLILCGAPEESALWAEDRFGSGKPVIELGLYK